MWSTYFENKYYGKDWEEYVSTMENGRLVKTNQLYKMGTIWENRDKTNFSVYDGATNFLGKINKDGSIIYNGYKDDYNYSFLKSAQEIIDKKYRKIENDKKFF